MTTMCQSGNEVFFVSFRCKSIKKNMKHPAPMAGVWGVEDLWLVWCPARRDYFQPWAIKAGCVCTAWRVVVNQAGLQQQPHRPSVMSCEVFPSFDLVLLLCNFDSLCFTKILLLIGFTSHPSIFCVCVNGWSSDRLCPHMKQTHTQIILGPNNVLLC